MQVVDTVKNENAGTVILPPGGVPVFAPMPGYDIKSAYEKHMKAAAAPAQQTGEGEKGTTGATAVPGPAAGYDAAAKSVTLADGRSVIFTDDRHMVVKLPGITGLQVYELQYHGSGPMRVMHNAAGAYGGKVGQSISGTGVTITLQSANGMPGGQLYDTAEGSNIPATVLPRVKPIVETVREALDTVKKVQPQFAKFKVVKSLVNNNLGM